MNRVRIDPGRWSTPAHIHGEAEEFVYVLGGSGVSWQDGATYSIEPGDCVVHRPGEEAHTLHADDEGLDVLIFGERSYDEAAVLPRAAAGWFGAGWVRLGGEEDHPWAREAAVGPPSSANPQRSDSTRSSTSPTSSRASTGAGRSVALSVTLRGPVAASAPACA